MAAKNNTNEKSVKIMTEDQRIFLQEYLNLSSEQKAEVKKQLKHISYNYQSFEAINNQILLINTNSDCKEKLLNDIVFLKMINDYYCLVEDFRNKDMSLNVNFTFKFNFKDFEDFCVLSTEEDDISNMIKECVVVRYNKYKDFNINFVYDKIIYDSKTIDYCKEFCYNKNEMLNKMISFLEPLNLNKERVLELILSQIPA